MGDSMGAMKTIMEGFLDDYNMSDLLYHRQRVLNAKISPLQVHQLSGFQERVRCFDTGRLLCLSQRPLRPEMVQTHFKVYLISSVCAPENVLQTKRERKRVAKKVFVPDQQYECFGILSTKLLKGRKCTILLSCVVNPPKPPLSTMKSSVWLKTRVKVLLFTFEGRC